MVLMALPGSVLAPEWETDSQKAWFPAEAGAQPRPELTGEQVGRGPSERQHSAPVSQPMASAFAC